jgi:TolB-like protein/Tfp pilus assembly protein PilF
MPDIFLSYNREDAAVAKLFADAFAREGFDVWWDATLRSGETYDEVTEAALRGARAVVVLWSPRSVVSHWVRAEATIAHRAKTLVPASIEPCDKPVMFELTQTADLAHWRGEADDPAWLAFLGDVRRMVGCDASEVAKAAPAPVPAPSSNGPGIPQAGVLPFTFRGEDNELAFLAEDLTEDVTRALAENDYFKVIAAGTMAALRGGVIDYRAIGKQFGVRYLAEGKLLRSGDAIRLTMQLIDADAANSVWSHRFAVSAEEMANNPEDFSRIVASDLTEHLIKAETKRAMTKLGPHSAWEHLLRAKALTYHGTDGTRRGVEEARRAVAAAPDFGLAHAELASGMLITTDIRGLESNDAVKREVREHLTRALQLDGDNPLVIASVALTHTQLGDGETSLRLARRAVELRPQMARCHYAHAGANFVLGRTAEAIAAYAEQLNCKDYDNPRHVAYAFSGWCYLLEGRPQEADGALEEALALNPDFHLALIFKSIAEALLGDDKRALATVRRLRELTTGMSLDQHVHFITQNPRLGRRSGDHIAILRRLWDATGGDG